MLKIYLNHQARPFSWGNLSNPLVVSLDADREAVSVQQLLLHNDNALTVYRNITLQIPLGQIPPDWTAKLLYQIHPPSAEDWLAINSGNLLSVPDILDLNYYPFWFFLKVPAGTMVQTLTGPKLLLSYTEQPA